MLIEYVTNRSRRTVTSRLGDVLIARGIAREVVEQKKSAPKTEPVIDEGPKAVETAASPHGDGISPVTGKPKRRYKRRDMQPEE